MSQGAGRPPAPPPPAAIRAELRLFQTPPRPGSRAAGKAGQGAGRSGQALVRPRPAGSGKRRSPRPAVRPAEPPCPAVTPTPGPHPAGTPVRRSPRPAVRPAPGSQRWVRSLWALAAQRRNLKRSPALLPLLPSCVRGPAQAQPLLPLSCGWRRGRRFLSDSNSSSVTHLQGSRRPFPFLG